MKKVMIIDDDNRSFKCESLAIKLRLFGDVVLVTLVVIEIFSVYIKKSLGPLLCFLCQLTSWRFNISVFGTVVDGSVHIFMYLFTIQFSKLSTSICYGFQRLNLINKYVMKIDYWKGKLVNDVKGFKKKKTYEL